MCQRDCKTIVCSYLSIFNTVKHNNEYSWISLKCSACVNCDAAIQPTDFFGNEKKRETETFKSCMQDEKSDETKKTISFTNDWISNSLNFIFLLTWTTPLVPSFLMQVIGVFSSYCRFSSVWWHSFGNRKKDMFEIVHCECVEWRSWQTRRSFSMKTCWFFFYKFPMFIPLLYTVKIANIFTRANAYRLTN